MLVLALLHEALFEEDRATGVGHKGTGSRQKDISGAILHLNPASEKRGIAGHAGTSFGGATKFGQ